MKAMKSIGLFLLVVLLSVGVAFSEGLLPGLEEVYGVEVPSFTDVIEKFPEVVQETERGISLTYFDVSDKHYYAYGETLEAVGCEVKDYSVDGETIKVIVSFKGKEFSFSYDSAANTMTVLFPEGVIESPRMTPTPLPTPTSSPTPTPIPTPVPTETPKPVNWSENAGYFIDLGEQNEFEFFMGQTIELKAIIKSLDNSNHNKVKVTWETSDESIATVNYKGQVTGISAGDAVITCRSKTDNDVYSLVFIHVHSLLAGDVFTFGHYEQDNNIMNGSEEIEWIILDFDEKNHKALLLSKYGLDTKPYNTKEINTTWEKCSLRNWLNGEFQQSAFSVEEQAAIITTTVNNSDSQGNENWKTHGGKNTQDKIFLLSYAETNRYLNVTYYDINNINARVAPTSYAIAQGVYNNINHKTSDGETAVRWWLRSSGGKQSDAAIVNSDGALRTNYVSNDYDSFVRPAFWLNLNLISPDLKSN